MDTKFNDVEIVFLYKYLMNFRSSNCPQVPDMDHL